eukprot:IDg7429t1
MHLKLIPTQLCQKLVQLRIIAVVYWMTKGEITVSEGNTAEKNYSVGYIMLLYLLFDSQLQTIAIVVVDGKTAVGEKFMKPANRLLERRYNFSAAEDLII